MMARCKDQLIMAMMVKWWGNGVNLQSFFFSINPSISTNLDLTSWTEEFRNGTAHPPNLTSTQDLKHNKCWDSGQMFTASQGSNWINWSRYEHLFLLASNPGLELKERFQLRSNQLRKQLFYVFRRRVAVASFTLATIALKLRSDQPVQALQWLYCLVWAQCIATSATSTYQVQPFVTETQSQMHWLMLVKEN